MASRLWRARTLLALVVGGRDVPGDVESPAWFAGASPLPTLFHRIGCKLLLRGLSLILAKRGSARCTGAAARSSLPELVTLTDMVASSAATMPYPIDEESVDIAAAEKGLSTLVLSTFKKSDQQ